MNKKVLKNVFFYGIGDFIVTGVTAFLFIPIYLKYLSASDYGALNVLNNNVTIFTYVFQFGIISAFSRIFFLKKAENTENAYIWTIIIFHIIYSLLLFVGIYVLRNIIFSNISPSIVDKKLLVYPVVMAFITFLPGLYYIFLRLQEKASVFVAYQIINVILTSIGFSICLIFFKLDIYSILISFIATNFILWSVVLIKFSRLFSFNIIYKDVVLTIKFAFPIFVSYIAYFFISKYSIVILQSHISLKQIGLFALAQQIASIPSLITIAITKAMQPYLFSADNNEDLTKKAQMFDFGFKLIIIWISGALIFSIDGLFTHLLPQAYYPIHNVAKYLLMVSLIYNFSIVENSILLYFMKSKTILVITVTGSLINVILSNVLVQKYSINGIIAAMLVAFSINLLLDIRQSSKHIKLNYNLTSITISISIILGYLVLSSDLFPDLKPYNLYLSGICLTILTLFIYQILNKKKYDFIKSTNIKS